jgi:bifunctional non-homologous end joining protein LigD
MSLKDYRKKRNFKLTSEPYGLKRNSSDKKQQYMMHKHAASHLHYDLRLELKGVLKSWAIPKGPSLDSAVKRLAVHVEDHPLEYGSFEGVIPPRQYGSGIVMIWDVGFWQCPDSAALVAYRRGDLTLLLQGKKLKGLWKLVQIKKDPKNWLLIKLQDRYARAQPYSIVDTKTRSAVTRRSLNGIARQATVHRKT